MIINLKTDEHVKEILKIKGSKIVNETQKIFLKDIESKDLESPFQFLAENWRDYLRPTLITLSCEAVGGDPETTKSAAVTMTLLCSCMNIYDDIMDRTMFKHFKPTFPGKFGNGTALIVGGLVTAKAFSILYKDARREIPPIKFEPVNWLFQDFLIKMAEAEMANLRLKEQSQGSVKEKFRVLQMQAIDIEACVKIGATIGYGHLSEINQLGKYGRALGVILRLKEDLMEALNLTLELTEKISSGSLPYALIWTLNHSNEAQDIYSILKRKKVISPTDVKNVVDAMFEATAIVHVQELIEKLIYQAKEALTKIRGAEARTFLETLVETQHSFFTAMDLDPVPQKTR